MGFHGQLPPRDPFPSLERNLCMASQPTGGSAGWSSRRAGTGNDFILIPDPDGRLDLQPEDVQALCDGRNGVGDDGVFRVGRTDSAPDLAPWSRTAEWFMDQRTADGFDGPDVSALRLPGRPQLRTCRPHQDGIAVRAYERGVEEIMSCDSCACAAATVRADHIQAQLPVRCR
jgi:hypothetical protein